MTPSVTEKLANKITAFRSANGLTMRALGERTGMCWQHLQKIETGIIVNPKMRTLQRLAEAFGVTIGELLS